MEHSTKNQIYISTLKTAIQKALTKNLPLILNDAVEYLENHDFEVKQRKRRAKTKSLQNIDDLQKKTQSDSAKKMKSTPYLNLNTNRVNSDSKKIKKKHPELQFGNLKQDNKIVWVCGTPGHLQDTLDTLKQGDEKSEPIWEPMSTISESDESDRESVEEEEEENEEPVEEEENEEPVEEEEEENEEEENEEPVEEEEEENEEPVENIPCPTPNTKKKWNIKNLDELSDNENDDKLLAEISDFIDLPENEVDPKTSTLVSSEIILQGDPPKKPKKLKRRKKNKPSGSLKPQKPKRLTKANTVYTNFEQRGTIF